MSTKTGLNIVTDGLELQIDAANKLGGNITDTKNIVTPTEVGTFVNGVSVVSGEYDFDGVDDYIDFGGALDGFGSKFTFDVWLKFDALAAVTIYSKLSAVGLADFGLFAEISNKFAFIDSGDGAVMSSTTSSSVTNTWFNITVTWDANVQEKIYVNGVLENTQASIFGYVDNNTYPFIIGAADNGASFFFNGKMKGLKTYNSILTATEISQNYEALKHRFE